MEVDVNPFIALPARLASACADARVCLAAADHPAC
jgi:hypothetical protein